MAGQVSQFARQCDVRVLEVGDRAFRHEVLQARAVSRGPAGLAAHLDTVLEMAWCEQTGVRR